jgi:hypothetical protein
MTCRARVGVFLIAGLVGCGLVVAGQCSLDYVMTDRYVVADLLAGVSVAIAAVGGGSACLAPYDWFPVGNLAYLGAAAVDSSSDVYDLVSNVEATLDRVGDLLGGLVQDFPVYVAVRRSTDFDQDPFRWIVIEPPADSEQTGSFRVRLVAPDPHRSADIRVFADALEATLPSIQGCYVTSAYLPGIGAFMLWDDYDWDPNARVHAVAPEKWEAAILALFRAESARYLGDLPDEEGIVVATPMVGVSRLYFVIPAQTRADISTWQYFSGM